MFFVFFFNNHHFILKTAVCVSLENQLDTSGPIASRGGGEPITNCDFPGDPIPILFCNALLSENGDPCLLKSVELMNYYNDFSQCISICLAIPHMAVFPCNATRGN